MYQINGFLKFTEEDIWEDGCQPGTASSYEVNVNFNGKTAAEVISKAADFLGVDEDGIERNACEEKGRVDFALTEDEDGTPLSKMQREQFKKGEIKAWYAIYTAYVERVTPANI